MNTNSYDENLFDCDTTGVSEMGAYEVFPSGQYPAIMITAGRKPTKDGNGAYLECVYQIIEGEFTGKKYTSRMNLWNANQQSVDIAKREMKSLKVSLGLPDTEGRTSMFINKPLVLNLGLENRKDDQGKPTDKPQNRLVSIEPYGQAVQQPSSAPPPPAYQQPQQQNYAPPPQNYAPPPQNYVPPQQPMHQQPQAQVPSRVAPAVPPAYQPNGNQPPPWQARR